MTQPSYPINTSVINNETYEEGTAPARNSPGLARITGGLLLVVVCALLVNTSIEVSLGISEQSAADAFTVYQHQQTLIFSIYYAYIALGMLFIAVALLLDRIFARSRPPIMLIATAFGVLAGLIQALGTSRWLILLPSLANTYADPHTSTASRAAIQIVYQTISSFLGMTVSEHLYYILIGLWSILFGITLLRTLQRRAWLGWLGIVAGPCMLIGNFEQLNVGTAFLVLWVISRLMWSIWLILLAALVLLRRQDVQA